MSQINNRTSRAVPLVSLSSRAVCGDGQFDCHAPGLAFASRCCPDAWPSGSVDVWTRAITEPAATTQ